MAVIRRLWTTKEAAQVRAALPSKLHHLIDELYTLRPTCYNCEHFIVKDSFCTMHEDTVPHDKRNSEFECFEVRVLEPF